MTYHRYFRVVALGLAALLLTAIVAFAKGSKTFNVPYAAMLGGTRIEAGHYQVVWEENRPEVTVTFASENGKHVVTTAHGRLEERSTKYDRNMLVYNAKPDGTQVISELRLGGSSKAIVFGQ